jgi:hypothetical protein
MLANMVKRPVVLLPAAVRMQAVDSDDFAKFVVACVTDGHTPIRAPQANAYARHWATRPVHRPTGSRTEILNPRSLRPETRERLRRKRSGCRVECGRRVVRGSALSEHRAVPGRKHDATIAGRERLERRADGLGDRRLT